MSWDENLFSWLYDKLDFRFKKKSDNSTAALLAIHSKRLQILASALTETSMEIRESSGWGGLINNSLFLPKHFSLLATLQQNENYYLWRVVAASLEAQIGPQFRKTDQLKILESQFPQFLPFLENLKLVCEENFEEVAFGAPALEAATSIQNSPHLDSPEKAENEKKISSEIQGKTKDLAKMSQSKEEEASPLVHVFEKINTIEDYQGGNRTMDGSDELSAHSDALNEVQLSQIIRTNKTSNSVYKSDALFDSPMSIDEKEVTDIPPIKYPEWFTSDGRYRKDWCSLYVHSAEYSDETILPNQKAVTDLKSEIESLMSKYLWVSRQPQGPDFDLQAIVDRASDIRAKVPPSDNCYINRKLLDTNISLFLLVDTSLSTESYSHEKKIIETIKYSVALLSAVFKEIPCGFSIATFSSQTRNACRFTVIKSETESWDMVDKKISAIKADGYTRIGPALRHSSRLLSFSSAKKKILLILSDSKPTDYDHYEGNHGIQDIKKAVQEARASGIFVKSLTFSEKKEGFHHTQYEAGNIFYVHNEQTLTKAIVDIWKLASLSR